MTIKLLSDATARKEPHAVNEKHKNPISGLDFATNFEGTGLKERSLGSKRT
jgi:hypothetical protein